MDSDRVVKVMAKWWQNVNDMEADRNARSPMLYDPLQEGKPSQIKQYIAAIFVCLGAVSAGTALAWTSPVIPQLQTSNADLFQFNITMNNATDEPNFYLTSYQASWVGSLLAIGAIFGAVPSGYIADKFGRKCTAIIMDIPFILSWLIIRYAASANMLYLGRFLIGISTGSFCVVIPMYISEIAETHIRGKLGTFFQLFLTIGILITNVVGSVTDWKSLSIVCLIFPSTLFAAMFFLPETPIYHLKKVIN